MIGRAWHEVMIDALLGLRHSVRHHPEHVGYAIAQPLLAILGLLLMRTPIRIDNRYGHDGEGANDNAHGKLPDGMPLLVLL
jgi:hypothetical protein